MKKESVFDIIVGLVLIVGVILFTIGCVFGFPVWGGWTRYFTVVGAVLTGAAVVLANFETNHID